MKSIQRSYPPPNIWDYHVYPCVEGQCTNSSQANVQIEAQTVFTDLKSFLNSSISGTPLATIAVGETWTNSNKNGSGLTCEDGIQTAASQTVTGFNASTLAGQSIAFRPFINLGSCYTPDNQKLNDGNRGPFTPAKQ